MKNNLIRRLREAAEMMQRGIYSPGQAGLMREVAAMLEDNRMIVLPCRLGGSIFRIDRGPDGKKYRSAYPKYEAVEFSADKMYGDPRILIFARVVHRGEMSTSYEVFTEDEFGKVMFCTREEADAAIEGRKC